MAQLIDGSSDSVGRRCGTTGRGAPQGVRRPRAHRYWASVLLVLALVATLLVAATTTSSSATSIFRHYTLVSPSYTPHVSVGSTDDYHCTLINPHVTSNSYVVWSRFTPGSPEVHHADLALVPPSLAATALRDNA
ncbi:MAG: hypothetical protein ACRDY1_02895, partial [Acidimicrobiales bacterium]